MNDSANSMRAVEGRYPSASRHMKALTTWALLHFIATTESFVLCWFISTNIAIIVRETTGVVDWLGRVVVGLVVDDDPPVRLAEDQVDDTADDRVDRIGSFARWLHELDGDLGKTGLARPRPTPQV